MYICIDVYMYICIYVYMYICIYCKPWVPTSRVSEMKPLVPPSQHILPSLRTGRLCTKFCVPQRISARSISEGDDGAVPANAEGKPEFHACEI